MKKLYLVCLSCFGLFFPALHAQFTGLWTVEEVKVGEKTMTPVAKWFQFDANQNLAGGNGGVRNTLGTYKLNATESTVLFHNEAGREDEYGPFVYSITAGNMQFQRVEDGQQVTVVLQRASHIPQAPWDEMVGFWNLKEGEAPGNMQSISIRWDRRFVMHTPNGRKGGIWHIDGHRPILRLISDAGDAEDSQWNFEFPEKGQLKWKRKVENKEEALLLLKQE